MDGQFHDKRGFPSKWERCRLDELKERIIEPSGGHNCLASVQLYRDAIRLHEEATPAPAPQETNGVDKDEQARAEREREADLLPDKQIHYLGPYADFDCHAGVNGRTQVEAIEKSRQDAARLATWFIDELGLSEPHVQCYFSGSKGFHVTVRPEPFGIQPHHYLTYMVKNFMLELQDLLKLETMDTSVYTISRLWRIPNTVHPKTGKYKIELYANELVNRTAEDIFEMASRPRNETEVTEVIPESFVWDALEYSDLKPDEELVKLWEPNVEYVQAQKELQSVAPARPITPPEDGELPVCIQDLMNNGPKPGGPNRNRVIQPLAGFYHDAGYTKGQAERDLKDWVKTHYPETGEIRSRLRNTQSVIDSAYRGNTTFACRFIRSLKGTGPNGTVACVGEANCPWIQKPEDQEPSKVPLVHLSDASKAVYVRGKIRTPVHVASISGQPYAVPLKGQVLCSPDPEAKICQKCPNLAAGGTLEWSMDAQDEAVLAMISVNENMQKGAIKRKAGIPVKCFKHRLEYTEMGNVEKVNLIPMVDHSKTRVLETGDVMQKWTQHVVRDAYHLGHGIKDNAKYIMEAAVFPFPKDQRVCFLSDQFETAQNDIDEFKMNDELYEQLLVFQPAKGQSCVDKIEEIHRDFTANVTQIEGRPDLSLAVDLCYHSVIGFEFLQQEVVKGWWELLVVGDSGTGKTTLVERLMQHFGLGEILAGEGAKKTGLVSASIQDQGRWVNKWGKIPQADRRLLIIDEFSAIPQEEVAKMTQLRSEGIARGDGVNTGHETNARTRLILLSNPRENRGKMDGFNYGVQAIEDLFKEAQDIRRVDFGMIVNRKEVDTAALNRRWDSSTVPHRYTSDVCRSLILWAWSRERNHIVWKEDAEDAVLRWAGKLGEIYDCDIPLAERSDLKLKLARISVSVATRLFSTDREAKKVFVLPEHVNIAARMMDTSYRKPAMAFFGYASKYKEDNKFTTERKAKIKKFLQSFDCYEELVKALLDARKLTKMSFQDMVTLDKDDFKSLWKFLMSGRLFTSTARGWRKTPAFTTFLQELERELKEDVGATAVFSIRAPEEKKEPEVIYDEPLQEGEEEPPF